MLRLLCVLILVTVVNQVAYAEPKLSPDPEKHAAFLLNPYDANKPDLIAFKDPRCPYCIKAFKEKETLDNYNVYVFWAPILGNTSARQVENFFHCDEPMGEAVINSVMQRKQIKCDNEFNQDLWAVNKEITDEYKPNSVPQYWYGDRKVWVTQLKLSQTNEQRIQSIVNNSPTRLPWQRYSDFLIADVDDSKFNLALVLGKGQSEQTMANKLNRLSSKFNLYVFPADSVNERSTEFLMLNNVMPEQESIYILEGKQLSAKELGLLNI